MTIPTLTQCKLRRGDLVHVAYIDSRFRIGDIVDISSMSPPNGWRIIDRYPRSTISEAEAIERSRDFARQRGASDI